MADTLAAYIPNTEITEVTLTTGFIDTTSYLTRINVSGPSTLTLGSGFYIGQLKKIQNISATTSIVGSQHFLAGLTQVITFTTVGDTAELMWTRKGWRIISTSNLAGTGATPTIT